MAKSAKKLGNEFQEDFVKSISSNLYVHRYKDSPTRFKNVANEGDYLVNAGEFTVIFECKTTKDSNLPLKNIGMKQVWLMLEATCKLNTFGGLLINFRKYNETYFVFISDFVQWYLNRTQNSLPLYWIREKGFKVAQKIKIKRYRYGVLGVLNWVENNAFVPKNERSGIWNTQP